VIFDYALEPELVATWHEWQSARYFKEKFGVGRGRLVSRYPSRWQALVWQAFDSADQNARKRLEALLSILTSKMVVRGSPYDGERTWLVNTEQEHERSPFHAILARTNPSGSAAVVCGNEIDEETEPRWAAPSSCIVDRDSDELAAAVAPMLRCCSEVIFIDPHFAPQELRFRRTLGRFLWALLKERPGAPPARIDLCVDQEKYGRGYFEQECRQKVPAVIPSGMKLRIVRLKQRLAGQPLHNRYILTDIGGVSFGHGLDESERVTCGRVVAGNAPAATDDVKRFEEADYRLRWSQYGSATLAFDRVEPPLEIIGKATVA